MITGLFDAFAPPEFIDARSPMNDEARAIIDRLQLEPLPHEGGFFRRTWSSTTTLQNGRAAGGAIYFLLTETDFSALHLLQTDELWLFHAGDPVEHVQLLETESHPVVTILGTDLVHNHAPQVVVRGRSWQGARLRAGQRDVTSQSALNGWALLSCIMAPEWNEREFTLGTPAKLLKLFPFAGSWIHALTR